MVCRESNGTVFQSCLEASVLTKAMSCPTSDSGFPLSVTCKIMFLPCFEKHAQLSAWESINMQIWQWKLFLWSPDVKTFGRHPSNHQSSCFPSRHSPAAWVQHVSTGAVYIRGGSNCRWVCKIFLKASQEWPVSGSPVPKTISNYGKNNFTPLDLRDCFPNPVPCGWQLANDYNTSTKDSPIAAESDKNDEA